MIYQFHRAPGSCRASFRVNDLRLLFTEREGAEWLSEKELEKAVPDVKAAALTAGVGEEEFRTLSAAAENVLGHPVAVKLSELSKDRRSVRDLSELKQFKEVTFLS